LLLFKSYAYIANSFVIIRDWNALLAMQTQVPVGVKLEGKAAKVAKPVKVSKTAKPARQAKPKTKKKKSTGGSDDNFFIMEIRVPKTLMSGKCSTCAPSGNGQQLNLDLFCGCRNHLQNCGSPLARAFCAGS
jgi:hypothetical protein